MPFLCWLVLMASLLCCLCCARVLQATARLVEYVPGGFGRTAALMHIKANAEEDMRATDSRVAGGRPTAAHYALMQQGGWESQPGLCCCGDNSLPGSSKG